jgi:hypothetical protein
LYKKLTATTLLAILLLMSAAMVFSASAQNTETATVVIASSVGGTVNPAPGTYTVNNGSSMTFTATPNSGFQFAYWVVAGNYTIGHNVPPSTVPQDITITPQYIPVYPEPSTSASDSLVITQNPLVVYHGFGYTYEYQAIFTPINSATPTPTPSTNPHATATATATSSPAAGNNTIPLDYFYTVVGILVVIAVLLAVVALVFARRVRK